MTTNDKAPGTDIPEAPKASPIQHPNNITLPLKVPPPPPLPDPVCVAKTWLDLRLRDLYFKVERHRDNLHFGALNLESSAECLKAQASTKEAAASTLEAKAAILRNEAKTMKSEAAYLEGCIKERGVLSCELQSIVDALHPCATDLPTGSAT